MPINKKSFFKNKRKRHDYYACYTYKGSHWVQYIYIKNKYDMQVIDLLLHNDYEKHAIILTDSNAIEKDIITQRI